MLELIGGSSFGGGGGADASIGGGGGGFSGGGGFGGGGGTGPGGGVPLGILGGPGAGDQGETFFGRINRTPQSAAEIWQWAAADKAYNSSALRGVPGFGASSQDGTIGALAAGAGVPASSAAASVPSWLLWLGVGFLVLLLLGVKF